MGTLHQCSRIVRSRIQRPSLDSSPCVPLRFGPRGVVAPQQTIRNNLVRNVGMCSLSSTMFTQGRFAPVVPFYRHSAFYIPITKKPTCKANDRHTSSLSVCMGHSFYASPARSRQRGTRHDWRHARPPQLKLPALRDARTYLPCQLTDSAAADRTLCRLSFLQ